MTEDIFVKIIDFPTTKVAETVTCNEDGSYTIFINAKLNKEQQNNAYIHALGHILRLDFECKTSNVDVLEAYAHYKGELYGTRKKA